MSDKTPSSAPQTGDAPPEGAAAAEQPAPDAQTAQAERPVVEVSPGVHKRLTTGLGGFTLAMGTCLLLVFAIYLVSPRGGDEDVPTVDYGAQLWAMRGDAPYTVHAPEGLPDRWRATSSRMHGLNAGGKEPVAWHLGFVTPGDEYAALEQSNEDASRYVPRMTNSSRPVGTQEVNGVTWTKYHREDKNANSLARTLPDGVSIVVVGTASYEELAVLAGALKPQSREGAKVGTSATPEAAS